MAWVIANKDVSSAITSASRGEQIEDIVKAVQVYKKITPEINKELDEILGNLPFSGINFRSTAPLKSRRAQHVVKNQYE